MEILPVGALYEPAKGQRTLLEQSRLGQEEFLQVLVAQLRNQNPLEPKADTDFISQLAQFDQLLSLQSLNDSMSAVVSLGQMGQAASLLGREIVARPPEANLPPITGVVSSVELQDGALFLHVGDLIIPASAVQEIREASAPA